MAEEEREEEKLEKVSVPKKKKGWFQKIPTDVLFSPGGIILIFFVIIVETIGFLVPIPILSSIIKLPFEIILIILLITVAKVSAKSLILPYVIDFFLPFLPTWIIRMFI